ncbi:hypothetical protein T02_4207 [Trichinella nativa]|uniref:Uncharacterized protein n=1 Tax=Trichinella nativa TaxID=6335 RepID=A0A0V1KN50_9BILA|nr:hypothetical protein T02_4207 [Trichinella nativa]
MEGIQHFLATMIGLATLKNLILRTLKNENLEHLANKITAETEVPLFYLILRQKLFDEIICVLNYPFSPQPSEIMKLLLAENQHGETVAEFITDLCPLCQRCKFVDLKTIYGIITQKEAILAEAARQICSFISNSHIHNRSVSKTGKLKRALTAEGNTSEFSATSNLLYFTHDKELGTLNAFAELNKKQLKPQAKATAT